MPTLRLTKEFRFEGAHALTGYDGKCRHIHGHSYLLYVTVKGTPSNPDGTPKSGMLIDFTDLKRIVNEHIIDIFDHSLILRESAPLAAEIASAYQRVITVPFQPTCENLILHFADIKAFFDNRLDLLLRHLVFFSRIGSDQSDGQRRTLG